MPLSICGEMAGDKLPALALIALGYRSFSVQPYAVPVVKYLLHHLHDDYLDSLREDLLCEESAAEIERRLRRGLRELVPFLSQLS